MYGTWLVIGGSFLLGVVLVMLARLARRGQLLPLGSNPDAEPSERPLWVREQRQVWMFLLAGGLASLLAALAMTTLVLRGSASEAISAMAGANLLAQVIAGSGVGFELRRIQRSRWELGQG